MSSNASSFENSKQAEKSAGCTPKILKTWLKTCYVADRALLDPHIDTAKVQVSYPDLGKTVDVRAAFKKAGRLNPDLPDALYDWLVTGLSIHKVARLYKIGKETLTRGRELLKEELKDYAPAAVLSDEEGSGGDVVLGDGKGGPAQE